MIGRCHSDVIYILHCVTILFINFIMLLVTVFWSFTLAPLVYQLSNICFMWCFIVRKMVMLKVILLALLFMIRIRFLVDKSITYILWSRYGNTLVKACVRYFLPNFDFCIKWKAFKNYEKCFLFHLKSYFHSRDIQIFVIFSLPFHTFQIQKGKWKWNNVINCLA